MIDDTQMNPNADMPAGDMPAEMGGEMEKKEESEGMGDSAE